MVKKVLRSIVRDGEYGGKMGDVPAIRIGPLGPKKALERMRGLLESGEVVFLRHAVVRMTQRGISSQDVEFLVMKSGQVAAGKTSMPGNDWRYVLEGRDIDGRRLRGIMELNGKLLVVSMIDLSRNR